MSTTEGEQIGQEADERAELLRRRQALAPEALAGDEHAAAELAAVEAQLDEHRRIEELRRLARAEEVERARAAEAAEAARQREQWAREKADVEAKRDAELVKIEKAIDGLVDLIPSAIELHAQAAILGKQIDPGAVYFHVRIAIENRLSRRLREIGINDLPPLRSAQGSEPLAVAKPRQRAKRI